MDAFIWDQRYMTGESIVDTEHQELVRIINLVVEKVSRATPATEIESILSQLVKYAVVHFRHEEELMMEVGCDPRFIAEHTQIHIEFARQVTKMREIPGTDTEDLLRFLTSWLAHHILGIDQSMARQVQSIRSGGSAETVYLEEQKRAADPTTSSLLDAMNSLYRLIAARNDSLLTLNQSLEQQVAARTQDLSKTNAALLEEQQSLKVAIQTVKTTQQKLLESEHKRSEAAARHMELFLSQIIDGDPVPTFVIDASHKITHWNRACAAISGMTATEMIGSNQQWCAFYPSARPVMADLIVDGSINDQFETYYHDKYKRSRTIDGAFEGEAYFPDLKHGGRWLFFTAAPLRDANGKLVGAIETLQDVTDRRRAEDDLREYQNHLEELVATRTRELASANTALENDRRELEQLLAKVEEAQQQLLQSEKMAAIGQLAAGVAHEINNPVGFVNSNLCTLKNYSTSLFSVIESYEAGDPAKIELARQQADLDFLKDDLPSLLAESQEGLVRVTKIVQNLKDFSRIDQAEHQQADLNAALESTLNVVWNELKYKADVIRELGAIPAVDCVPAQINQVFMNLLVNAAQSIPERGQIHVRSGSENSHVWFEIEDNGIGMSEEIRRRIFEPFFTTKPVGKGTGLGLSISYDIIVKKHGGRMDVRSEPGKGSCFRIWLPLTFGEH
ncbi:bacteriohemerythrin [Dechloromonas denitrificans]|uniref:bacteriohemerythrin n=1 Tax=Dechloromonas denitrificans TaxID=281362 RepID=UPI001CF8FA9C|nr:bacteriohemerythrin [Dechloromonas denitrificans]UCV10858.1 bacteriohemerythrin [Dechloromonas denitrificans]